MNNFTNKFDFNNFKNTLSSLNINTNLDDYKFLLENKYLGNNIMLLGLGGSYAYGTNVETSDLDIRGITSRRGVDLLLGKDIEEVCDNTTDTTIYTFDKMIKLLTNCNPNTIEILGLKPEHYLYMSDMGKKLIDKKDIFLSQKCINSFMGYATMQLYRLRQKSLQALTPEELNKHIVKVMEHMVADIDKEQFGQNSLDVWYDENNNDIMLNLNIEGLPIGKTNKLIEIFTKTYRDYQKQSSRNRKALEHNKISKHAMHLLRLYMMCSDILLYGEINTYREKEHDLLMAVRNDEFLDDSGKPNDEFYKIVDDYEAKLMEAKNKTVLPLEPDYKAIEQLKLEINYSIIKNEVSF